MKFLETITFLGDPILIPIDRIKFVVIKYDGGWEIKISGDNEMDLSEHFGDDQEKANKRYDEIKKIIEGA
jgi:hypothetical protein